MEKDEKYWKDYTEFLNAVEQLSQLSPAGLLTEYKILVEELKDADEAFYSKYELDYDIRIRQEIQNVIESKSISGNILLKNFILEIEKLDSELKIHLHNSDQSEWWNNIQLKFNS